MPRFRLPCLPADEAGARRAFYLASSGFCVFSGVLLALFNPEFDWFGSFYATLVPLVLLTQTALTLLLWLRPGSLAFVERALFAVGAGYNLAVFARVLYIGSDLDIQGYANAYSTFSPLLYVWAFLAFGRRGLWSALLFMGSVLALAAPYVLGLTPARADSGTIVALVLSVPTVGGAYLVMLYALTHFLERNVRARASAEAEARLAYLDPLTGLPNRLLFDQRLGETFHTAQRERQGFALAFIDLDAFKAVNDTFGHAAGDALLKEVATRLGGPLRASDTLARISGDEFAVILPMTASPAAVEGVAERLLGAFEVPFNLGGVSYRASASMGFALYHAPQTLPHTPDMLLAQADKAMYVAKRCGRNGYHLYAPGTQVEPQTHAQKIEVTAGC